MNPAHWRAVCAIAFATVLACVSGCDRDEPPVAPAGSPAGSAPAQSSPSPAVSPAPSGDAVTRDSPAAGPATGGSAIGGVAGGENQPGAGKGAGQGDAPAPTGGDGAATPAPDSKKQE